MLRHGDVILIPLDERVEGEGSKECTLALGEVTGHSHRIEEGAVRIAYDPAKHGHILNTVYEKLRAEFAQEFPKERFPFAKEDIEIGCLIRAEKECKLVHEEHHALTIPEGSSHAVIIQRNYSPKGWSKVLD